MNKINVENIKKKINNNRILNNFVFFSEIDSTNRYLIQNRHKTGTIALAETQISGYGKRGAEWESSKGGLWFSFVINESIKKPYIYIVLISVAILDSLTKYKISAKIKWPNDILVNGKKVAGILIENDVYSKKLVAGIGIDVNNDIDSRLSAHAGALKDVYGKEMDLSALFVMIIKRIDYYLGNIKKYRRAAIIKWIKNQVDVKGKEIKVLEGSKIIKGRVVSVLRDGSIKLAAKDGKIKTVSAEIFFI